MPMSFEDDLANRLTDCSSFLQVTGRFHDTAYKELPDSSAELRRGGPPTKVDSVQYDRRKTIRAWDPDAKDQVSARGVLDVGGGGAVVLVGGAGGYGGHDDDDGDGGGYGGHGDDCDGGGGGGGGDGVGGDDDDDDEKEEEVGDVDGDDDGNHGSRGVEEKSASLWDAAFHGSSAAVSAFLTDGKTGEICILPRAMRVHQ